jgi:D-alanyl-D-alanine carboxypeptidase-like protein
MRPGGSRLKHLLITFAASLAATTAAPAAPPPPQVQAPTISPVTAERLGTSWRPGCPVSPAELRLVSVTYLGFDGGAHRGELVVADAVAREVADIFTELYAARFPIERIETVEKYNADDAKSMAANNTSAFNCRPITGGTTWSQHSYGRAIDVNTLRNPYISRSGIISPPNGAPFVDRHRTDPGMIHADDNTVRAFRNRGWVWGGEWRSPIDYQHFEKPSCPAGAAC